MTINRKPNRSSLSRRHLLCLGSAAIISLPAQAGTVAGFGGSTEITQIANNIQLGLIQGSEAAQFVRQGFQLAEQVKTAAHTILSYRNMIENTLQLGVRDWLNVEGAMRDLYQVVQSGEALSYTLSNIDDIIRREYGTVEEYLASPLSQEDYNRQYDQWSRRNRDTIAASMASVGMNINMIDDEAALMREIQRKSESTQGRTQLLQVSHEIADQQVQQIQKLRQLMASNIQMQGAVYAKIEAREAADEARIRAYYAPSDDTIAAEQGRRLGGN